MKRSFLFSVASVLSLTLLFSACDDDGTEPVEKLQELEVTAGPDNPCIAPGESITLEATITSRGVPPYTYAWNFGDPDVPDATGATPSVTFPNKGRFYVQVTVTDSEGKTAKSSSLYKVRIKDNCAKPVATIDVPSSDITVLLGTTVPFAGSATGGDPPYTYGWSFSQGGDLNNSTASDETTDFQFLFEGTWFVTLVVNDNAMDFGQDRRTITVVGSALNISIDSPSPGETYGKNTGVHCAATVTGAVLSPGYGGDTTEAAPNTFLWSFGAGSGIPDSAEEFPNVQYATKGNYTISVTVTNGGNEASDTVDISIIDVISLNPPVFVVDKMVATPPGFAGSTTPDGGMLLFGWNGASVFNPTALTFSPIILTDTNMDNGAVATPAGGPETIIYHDNLGSYISYSLGGSSFDTPIQLGTTKVKSVSMFGDDPTSDAFVITTTDGIKYYDFNSSTQQFEMSAEFLPGLFPGMTGALFAAVVRTAGSGMLVASGGRTGQIWFHDGVEGNNATLAGNVGDSAKLLDVLGNICVVGNTADSTCTVVTWDSSNNIAVHETFSSGTIPKNIDLMLLDNGNTACIVAAWDFNLTSMITVAEITPSGTLVSNNTFAVPGVCIFPNSVLWIQGTTNFAFYCQADGNLVVLSSGL